MAKKIIIKVAKSTPSEETSSSPDSKSFQDLGLVVSRKSGDNITYRHAANPLGRGTGGMDKLSAWGENVNLGGRKGYFGVNVQGNKYNVGIFDENTHELLMPLGTKNTNSLDALNYIQDILRPKPQAIPVAMNRLP